MSRDEQDRVIASDRADHLRQLYTVDRQSERLGLTRVSSDHQELLHLVDPAQILPDGTPDRSVSAPSYAPRGTRPSVGPVGGALDKLELLDITGDGGLGRMKPACAQPLPEVILAADGLVGNENRGWPTDGSAS